MFDSGISVKELVEELNAEVDIALEIPDSTYVSWLNSLQQFLYTEIIKEQKKTTLKSNLQSPISLSAINIGNDENRPRFEDIYAIYVGDTQLIKSTLTSGVIFPNTFYKDNNDIGFNTKNEPAEMTIVYIVKPALVTTTSHGNISDGVNVMVPVEFIDLVKAKLRGEAYKLANENDIAANWLNDYNVILETFKVWIADKSPNFGM